MAEKMLKFVDLGQKMPEKRAADTRARDFHEIYAEFLAEKAADNPRAARNAACRFARSIARCTTTSPTG